MNALTKNYSLLFTWFIVKLFINQISFAQCGFGNEGANFTTNTSFSANYLLGTRHYNSTASTITHLGMKGNGTNAGVILALYSDNGGTPGYLIAHTGIHTVDTGNLYFPIPITNLADNEYYWIMAVYNGNGSSTNHTLMSSASKYVFYAPVIFGTTLPNNFSGTSYYGQDFMYWASSMEVNYTNIVQCNPYTWNANGQTYSSSTQEEVITLNGGSNGCHLSSNLNLQIVPNTISVINNGSYLSANILNGNSYQWLDCDNGMQPIPNATYASYYPSQSGNYAVQITFNDCVKTSSCTNFSVNNTSIETSNSEQSHIFPNPASTLLSINNISPTTHISIIDITGKTIISEKAFHSTHTINIEKLSNGLYIIQLENNGQITQKKLVVNK